MLVVEQEFHGAGANVLATAARLGRHIVPMASAKFRRKDCGGSFFNNFLVAPLYAALALKKMNDNCHVSPLRFASRYAVER